MSRPVISSPFQFGNQNGQPVNAGAPVNSVQSTNVPPPSNPPAATGRHAPPPSFSTFQENKANIETQRQNPQETTQSSPFPPSAPGGKLSAFAELSNRQPPPLYEVQNTNNNLNVNQQQHQQQQQYNQHTSYQQSTNFSINEKPKPGKIIPSQDPSKVEKFYTNNNPIPPPACRNYSVVDQGNCSPRFIRSSTYSLPNNSKLATEIEIPLGLVLQPLADPKAQDTQIPLIHPSPNIVRCVRCGAYHNALDKYTNQGNNYICFLCSFENTVPKEFYSPLSLDGTRLDLNQRPELYCGTVEYVAPSEYITKPPTPLSLVFVIETSIQTQQSGIIQSICESLLAILKSLPKNTPLHFGFVTFHHEISFYSFHEDRSLPQILVMTEREKNFLPTGTENLMVSYHNCSDAIEKFIKLLPNLCNQSGDSNEICTGAAIRSAGLLLKETGGKVIVFQSSMPNAGPGSMINRYKEEYLGTSREKELFTPYNSYYHEMANDCSNYNISFDLFITPKERSFIDVSTISPLCKRTGGQLYYFPNFIYQNDRLTLHNELFTIITKTTGKNAISRIRTSPGVEITGYHGFFKVENTHDLLFSTLSSNTTIAANLKITENLPDESFVGFQCALLYTTCFGERRIRIHSLRIPVSQHYGKVIAAADVDSILFLNSCRYLKLSLKKELKLIRSVAVNDCLQALVSFKKKSASNSIGLSIPDSLRLLPLYQLCLLKTSLLKETRVSYVYIFYHL